jgi:fumarate hydratase class I
MTVIKQDDLIQSIADALQFISYYHPTDFIRAMRGAWEKEESPAAKAALTQVLVNSRMCAIGKRPICQDTGIVNVLVSVGMDVQWDADMAFEDMINEGVRRGYTHPDNVLPRVRPDRPQWGAGEYQGQYPCHSAHQDRGRRQSRNRGSRQGRRQ